MIQQETGNYPQLSCPTQAHDTKYALRRRELEAALQQGKRIVANVSRSIIEPALERYGPEHEVYALLITAREATLEKRLFSRGRESAAEVEKRVRAGARCEPVGEHVVKVLNEGSIETGAHIVTSAIRGTLKYSLWLCPSLTNQSQPIQEIIDELPGLLLTNNGISDVTAFPAHVTLCSSFEASQQQAIAVARAVAMALPEAGVDMEVVGVSHGEELHKCVFLDMRLTDALQQAHLLATDISSPFRAEGEERESRSYLPHASLVYALLDASTREGIMACLSGGTEVALKDTFSFTATDLVLAMTTGSEHQCWVQVCRICCGAS